MSTNTATPTLGEHERDLTQPWFDISGHTSTAPQWATAWQALRRAELADEHGLRLWPVEEDRQHDDHRATATARTIRLALEAGALLGDGRPSDPREPATAVAHAGEGVEVVLAILRAYPALTGQALDAPGGHAAAAVADHARSVLVGVYDDARHALNRLVGGERPPRAPQQPPVSALVLREVLADEVFCEHVLLCLEGEPAGGFATAVFPSRRFLVFRTPAPLPDRT